jgi:hypothetical protein
LGSDEHPPASIDAIAASLRIVVRTGIEPARLRRCGDLLALRCVSQRCSEDGYPDTVDGRALALHSVVIDAVARLGDGPLGNAAQSLFGAVAGTRGRPLRDRRRLAAAEFDRLPATFREHYEADILADVAAEIFRTEVQLP